MKKAFKIAILVLLFLAILATGAVYVSSHEIPVLNPMGKIGIKERDLIVTASLLMMIVVIPVLILTWIFAWKYRESNKDAKHTPDWEHNNLAEYCWWGVPFLIIVVLAFITWKSSYELNPFKPLQSDVKPITIQAVALEWKWLFIYPEEGIATINYIEFPEETPLNFEITADAPMNSFWIPRLGGMIYAMPAMRTKLHLIAKERGEFLGRSSSYSGKGFAGMTFKAVSTSKEGYRDWVTSVRRSNQALNQERYNEVLEPSSNDQVQYFTLPDRNLFDRILDKYLVPSEGK